MDDRFGSELQTPTQFEPIQFVTDKERMAQFAVAVVMVLGGIAVTLLGMTYGTAATICGAALGVVLAAGAIVLAQDRKP